MSPAYDVFLSHSSADKRAVERLARKLRDIGIEPFLDTWHLIPGRVWQEELERALQESRSCAIFVGSESLGPWLWQEMLVALDKGARDPTFAVIPVLLPGFQKPNELPAFLSQRSWVEFHDFEDEDAFHRLVSGIRGTAPGPGKGEDSAALSYAPYRSMAQPPEEFIHRREYDIVLEALCAIVNGVNRTSPSVGITTALRGAGGFGKTALAQAVCQNPQIWQIYPDGILWATMGEDIGATGRLSQVRDLIRWWTCGEAPAFETVNAAGARLRELLAGSRVLVVIDDVWNSADVTPFQGLGNGSALLITTRDSQTLPTDAKLIEVDAMASPEAVSLLRSGLPDGPSKDFKNLAARLSEWPLLLKLVNRQLQELVNLDRLTVPKALSEVEAALKSEGFSAFDRDDKESRHAAASRTILVSVRRLSEEERTLYFYLAVFPEDVQIPVSVLERFWGKGHFQVRKFCRRLHDLSLLFEFGVEGETVRLHDVVRRVLIEYMGREIPSLHGRLLDIFKPSSGSWSDLPPEEGYLWRQLFYHFLGAERRSQFRDLLFNLKYLEAKLKATDINTLIADYEVFAGEREPHLVRDAFRLSAHVLARDPQQLAPQLLGRLLGFEGEDISRLLQAALSWDEISWLRPRKGSLAPPGGPLVRTLEGHIGGISALAVVDERLAVSGSYNGKLQVWDLETGETLRTLEGHTGEISAIGGSRNRVVSGSHRGELWVWDLETGETLRTLDVDSIRFNTVVMVDRRRSLSCSYGLLQMWDIETGETLCTLQGHTGEISAVAVVDDRRVVSGSSDTTLRIWDLETSRTLRVLKGHSGGISAVAIVDARRAVSGSSDGTFRVWDLETGEPLRTFEGHSGWITAVAAIDRLRAVSGSSDGTLRIWSLETGETLQTFEGHSGKITAVVVLGGGRIVSGSSDGTLRVWDFENGESLRFLDGHSSGVSGVAVVDGHRVVTGSYDQTLRVWSLETSETLYTLTGHWGWINTVTVVDSCRAVSGSDDETLRVWDLETGETLRILEGHSSGVYAVAVLDDCRIVSGSESGRLRVWDLKTGKNLRILEGHWGWISSIALVENNRVISSSNDGMLRVWNLENGKILNTFRERSGKARLVVIDGCRILSGSENGALRIWNFETGETFHAFQGHSDEVRSLTVMDSHRAISGSTDRTLRVWDLETGKMLATTTLDAAILSVAVIPDRKIVVAGDLSGRVHFFDLVEPE